VKLDHAVYDEINRFIHLCSVLGNNSLHASTLCRHASAEPLS
jgi:hypothetical protein